MAKRIFAVLLTAALLTAGMAACSGQQQAVEEETVQLPADEEQQEARILSTPAAEAEKKPELQPLDEVQGERAQDEMDKSFDEILRIFNKDKF